MRARVVAPLVAALVGVVAGTVTALVTIDPSDDPDGPASSDPLRVGVDMVNRACTGEGLLVVGYGDTSGSVRQTVTDNPDLDLTYLETDGSCDTNFGPERLTEKPTYAVVAGPYPTLQEPCELRMTPTYRGDFVTALREGNRISVKCVCVLDDSAAPELSLGMTGTEEDVVWVRSLQQLLVDRELLTKQQVTGVYDIPTRAAVLAIQKSSGSVPDSGEVDQATWRLVKDRICRDYDF